jgi:hypothetical protein
LIGLIPLHQWNFPHCKVIYDAFCGQNTIFATYPNPPCQGWSPGESLLLVTHDSVRSHSHNRDDASHQSLQPTSCHENPVDIRLPGFWLAPLRPFARTSYFTTKSFRMALVCCHQHFQPWVGARLTPPYPSAIGIIVLPCGVPFGHKTALALSAFTAPMLRPRAPFVVPIRASLEIATR